MPIVAECPACGFKVKVSDQFRGRKAKCRECSKPFVVGGDNAAQSATVAPAPQAKRQSDPEPGALDFLGEMTGGDPGEASSPFADLDSAAPEPRPKATSPRKSDSDDPSPVKKSAAPKRAFKKKIDREPVPVAAILLGVLAVLLGVAGLMVRDKGLFGLASVPLGGVGLFLAVGGLITAKGQPALGLPAPALGLLLCLVAIALGGIETYKLVAAGALSEADPVANISESTEPESAKPGPADPRIAERRPIAMGVADGQWADPRRGIRVGNAFVRVGDMAVDFVRVLGAAPDPSPEKRLLIRLEIANLGKEGVDYFGWALTDPKPGETPPTLVDDNGIGIRRIALGKGQVPGLIDSQTIHPRRAIADLLIFAAPPDRTQFLRLELSATNLGGIGKLRFQIPMSMLVVRKQTAPPKDEPKGALPPLPAPPPLPPEIANLKGSERVESLRQDLKKPLPKARIDAAAALGKLGPDASAAVADLVSALREDRSEEVRRACAEALGLIGPGGPGRAAIPALTFALRDEFWRVQTAAARSLGQMGPAAKNALPELMRLTKSKDEEVPNRAKEAIHKIDPNAVIK